MNLAEILPAAHVMPQLAGRDKWQVIDEMLGVLEKSCSITTAQRKEASSALWAREQNMSTGIGDGIAIPHATADGLPGVVAAFGRAAEGIEWEALDEKPVQLVILFLVPKTEFQQHLSTLAAIAKFMNRDEESARLLAAKGVEEIRAVLAEGKDAT